MKRAILTATSMLLALAAASAGRAALAQDAAVVSPQTTKVIFENEYIRVIRSTFAKGQGEPAHVHPPGWVYTTQGGTLSVTPAGGKAEDWSPKTGESEWDPGEGAHTAVNTGPGVMEYIYVEVKAAAKK